MRRAMALAVLAILVAAGLSLGYLAVNPGRQTATSNSSQETSVSASKASAAATSTISSSGLELRVELNATIVAAGSALDANVTVFNRLDHNVSLSSFAAVGPNSIGDWANYDFICANGGPVSYLVGFAVLPGHFSAGNLSQASGPLQLAAQAALPCLSFLLSGSVTFASESDSISIPGSGFPWQPATLNVTTYSCIVLGGTLCRHDVGLFGYWSTSEVICCPSNSTAPELFRYLTPGEYTLAAQDAWGQTVFAYFRVARGPSPAAAVSAQESPFSSPGSPVIGITLANFGDVPITSIGATLRYSTSDNTSSPGYPFAFVVNSTDPLLPGQTTQDVRTLQGDLFDIGVRYPLTIAWTFGNGTVFTYTQQVQFVNSVPSW